MLSFETFFVGRGGVLSAAILTAILLPTKLIAQDVLTWKNDNQRTGQNLSETTLTPSNVGSPSFGKLFSQGVDENVYAQPLHKSGVSISGKGTHNVVFVASENNSVYAFDADDNSGSNTNPLWQVNLGLAPNVNSETGPVVGITGTPVIDPSSGTLYVVAITVENGSYFHRLHALDIGSGAEKFGGPVVIQPSVPGTGADSSGGKVTFNPHNQNQRPALLLIGGVVYVASGVQSALEFSVPYHGWVIGFNASTLAQVSVYNNTPNDQMGGIWMAGAIGADTSGNIFAVSGNGSVDPSSTSLGNSVIKLSSGLSLLDYFSPHDTPSLNSADLDLGSGGCLILPSQPGTTTPNLIIQGGKEAILHVLNRDNLGKYDPSVDHVVQEVNIPNAGYLMSTPTYFFDGTNRWIFVKDTGPSYGSTPSPLWQYKLTNGLLSSSPITQSSDHWGSPLCGSPVVSANGTSNGIVWAIEPSNPAVLRAWDATNLNTLLYSSSSKASDQAGPGVKFTCPTVANGKVYVGTSTGLYVYGLTTPTAPTITTQPVSQSVATGQKAIFSVVATGTASLSYQWQKNNANITGATSSSYTTPATILADNGSTYRCIVTNSAGSATSNAATLTVTGGVAPTITTQPANQTVTAGQTATFTVAATGTATLSYQWQRLVGATWTNVGTNSFSYATSPTTVADTGGMFRVIVFNGILPNATSNSATLTVNPSTNNLPAPWGDQDIGTVGIAGSANDSGGTFTVVGSGAGITGTSDQFNFASQPLSGDGEISVQVTGLGTVAGAQVGVMVRTSLATNSVFAFTALEGGGKTAFLDRTSTGGTVTSTAGPAATAPYWVRLVRSGDTFTSFVSPDGTTWIQIGSPVTIAMGANVLVGLAVTSGSNSSTNTATMAQVTFGGGWVPPPPQTTSSGGGKGGGCGLVGLDLLFPLGIIWAMRRRRRGA